MSRRKAYDFAEEQRRYDWLRKITDEAIAARTKGMEFHGLEEELRNLQRSLLESYERSKSIKHPRDKGDHREEILRHFLREHGLLPESVKVPSVSTRMVSPSGHISPELDVLFINRNDSLVLKKFENTLEYYPVESVLGTIQVKSKLTGKELASGLEHIQRFKSIRPTRPLWRQMGSVTVESPLRPRFGILFAFELGISWGQVVKRLGSHAEACPNALWPNMVVILGAGCLVIGDEKRGTWDQRSLEGVSKPRIHGNPDLSGHCLQEFYSVLLYLLRQTDTGSPHTGDYLRMPMAVGEHSVEFVLGPFSELAVCPDHGPYSKKLTTEKIDRILAATRGSKPINWVKALDLADGKPGTDTDRYERQPAETIVYDPDGRGFEKLLKCEEGFLTYESILINGQQYWLPRYYVDAHKLIEPCPMC